VAENHNPCHTITLKLLYPLLWHYTQKHPFPCNHFPFLSCKWKKYASVFVTTHPASR
jgi:hypothetical protein